MKAVLRGIRITPKKANLIAGTVRGKSVNEALALLKFMPKKGARILYKVIQSAASNAKNNFDQSFDDLIVAKVWAVKGPTLKRGTPANRGRMWPIHEIFSHITVEVGLPEGMTPRKPASKKGAKEEAKSLPAPESAAAEKPKKKTSKPRATTTKPEKTPSKKSSSAK